MTLPLRMPYSPMESLSVDTIPLPDTAPGAMVGFYVRANTLDKATIEVTYGR